MHVYAEAFGQLPEVVDVRPNSSSGSLVLRYPVDQAGQFLEKFALSCLEQRLGIRFPLLEDPEIIAKAEAEIAHLLGQHSELAVKTMALLNSIDLELRAVSNNTIDLNVALIGGLAIFVFMGIGAAASTPMWVTLALYAVNHAVQLQSRGLVPVPATSHASLTT